MKTNISKTFQGYEIEIDQGIHTLTVSHIYNNIATCYLHGSRAKHYKNKATAERIAKQIETGEIRIK